MHEDRTETGIKDMDQDLPIRIRTDRCKTCSKLTCRKENATCSMQAREQGLIAVGPDSLVEDRFLLPL